jgi:Family of unknown function (DUF6069)
LSHQTADIALCSDSGALPNVEDLVKEFVEGIDMSIAKEVASRPAGKALRHGLGTVRAAAVLAATAGGLLVWFVADPLAGTNLTVGTGSSARAIGPGAVALVSALAGLAAVGLAVVLSRLAARARPIWYTVAVAVLVLSLSGPLGAVTLGAGLALAAMHLVVGATLIVGVGRTVSARRLGE